MRIHCTVQGTRCTSRYCMLTFVHNHMQHWLMIEHVRAALCSHETLSIGKAHLRHSRKYRTPCSQAGPCAAARRATAIVHLLQQQGMQWISIAIGGRLPIEIFTNDHRITRTFWLVHIPLPLPRHRSRQRRHFARPAKDAEALWFVSFR